MLKLLLVLLFVGNVLWAKAQTTLNPKFEQKIESLITHSIPTITCGRLHKKLSTPGVVVLDAREKEEFTISHIQGAQWVGYNTFDKRHIQHIDKDAFIVVYCSVGYRSEKIGEQLKEIGYSNVHNLYGGIFEWANHSYPVVDYKEQSTQSIHTYNKEWGNWLDKGKKVY